MTATLIGATGLIGSHLLQLLLQDQYFETVRILVRRPFELTHSKLEKKIVDFNNMESYRLALEGSDVIFCTVGTTQKKVKGNKEAYRKVDYDIPVHAAQLGKLCGCKTFILVSAIGANSKSSNFYLQLKGEVEDAVKAVGLQSVHIMQPSILLGKRNEFRLGERIGQFLMNVLSFLIPNKYKPIKATTIATAMLNASKKQTSGCHIYSFKEIKMVNKEKEIIS
jgi:uncharacterized protein YbjT (DUF2867 family)